LIFNYLLMLRTKAEQRIVELEQKHNRE